MLPFNKSSLSTDSGPGPLLELGTGGQGDSRRPILRELASNCIVSDALCHLFGPSSEGLKPQILGSSSRARCGQVWCERGANQCWRSSERVGGAIPPSSTLRAGCVQSPFCHLLLLLLLLLLLSRFSRVRLCATP